METEKQYIFDNPKNVKRLLNGLYICCAVLVGLDFVIHRHVYHSWENIWAFYPIYGFIGCVVLVVIAKWMRIFLMRPEDYYNPVEEPETGNDIKTDDNEKTGGSYVAD